VAAQGLGSNGSEYPIVGSYEGDQLFTSAAYDGRYGFVVWQDSKSDGKGSGIVARQLSSGYSAGLSSVFHVNQITAGDQERPKVALFPDRSALFCWHGGPVGKTKVYARVLGKSGSFLGNDIVVSQPGTFASSDPSVAVLANGNAVITWSCFGSDGDMLGVYARVIGSNGQWVTPIVQVNQFVNYNQRDASVAALVDGGFAVVWVSEQQRRVVSESRSSASVDIFLRVFDSVGVVQSGEIRLNTADRICSNPAISRTAAGKIVVAWTERDANREIGWDVIAGSWAADGTSIAAPARINVRLQGNQYVPSLAAVGEKHLVAWTSTGQDGNQTGIYGRWLEGGQALGDEFQINTWTPASQMQPSVVSDERSECAVLWSTFLGARGFDIHAQRYTTSSGIPQPEPPFVTALSQSALQASWPTLVSTELDHYELNVDSSVVPVTASLHSASGFAPGSSHSFKLRYVMKNGAQSAWSETVAAKTWGPDDSFDGLPDDWQVQFWGANSDLWPAGNVDSDGDGASNLKEFQAGTNPIDATSNLRLRVTRGGNHTVLSWNAVPGYVYQVQTSDNLLGPWTDLGGIRLARTASDSITIGSEASSAIYRVIRLR